MRVMLLAALLLLAAAPAFACGFHTSASSGQTQTNTASSATDQSGG